MSSEYPPQKWRLVDAGEYLGSGLLKLIQVSSLGEKPFVAISYRWTKAITDWRTRIIECGNAHPGDLSYETRLALGSLTFSTLTHDTLIDDASAIEGQRFLSQAALNVTIENHRYFWMDIVCINQDVRAEKEFFVPKMGTLYESAAITHVYPIGTTFLSTLESQELYFPIWETRAWTLQEQIVSRNVIFCYLFDGEKTDEVIELTSSGNTTCMPPRTLNGSVVTSVDGIRIDPTTLCIFWQSSEHATTCILEREGKYGGLPTTVFIALEIGKHGRWSGHQRAIGRNGLYKSIFALRQGDASPLKRVRTALMFHGGREATLPHDMLYSLLGVLDMEYFPVSYSISPEEARLAFFEAMTSQTLSFVVGTDWGYSVSPNCDSALPRIYNSHPIIGDRKSTRLNSSHSGESRMPSSA